MKISGKLDRSKLILLQFPLRFDVSTSACVSYVYDKEVCFQFGCDVLWRGYWKYITDVERQTTWMEHSIHPNFSYVIGENLLRNRSGDTDWFGEVAVVAVHRWGF